MQVVVAFLLFTSINLFDTKYSESLLLTTDRYNVKLTDMPIRIITCFLCVTKPMHILKIVFIIIVRKININEQMKKKLRIVTVYGLITGILLAIVFFLGTSDYIRNFINSNPYSDFSNFLFNAPWMIMLFLIPAIVAIFIVHLLSVLIDKKIVRESIFTGILVGFIGPLILCGIIAASSDGEAQMVFIAIGFFYCVFAIIGFILSCIVLTKRKHKSINKNV